MYVCMYVCMYIYIYVYVHIYIISMYMISPDYFPFHKVLLRPCKYAVKNVVLLLFIWTQSKMLNAMLTFLDPFTYINLIWEIA